MKNKISSGAMWLDLPYPPQVEGSPFVIKVTKSVLLIDSTNGYIAHVPTGTFILSCFENICASLWRNELKCCHLFVTI
jgi:hypothetical protein